MNQAWPPFLNSSGPISSTKTIPSVTASAFRSAFRAISNPDDCIKNGPMSAETSLFRVRSHGTRTLEERSMISYPIRRFSVYTTGAAIPRNHHAHTCQNIHAIEYYGCLALSSPTGQDERIHNLKIHESIAINDFAVDHGEMYRLIRGRQLPGIF